MPNLTLDENHLKCIKCGLIKPMSEFVQAYLRRRWPHKICKECCYSPLRKGKSPSKKQIKVCKICGNEFSVDLNVVKHGHGQLCSVKCRRIYVGKILAKDGTIHKDRSGYVWILKKDHPRACMGRGYVKRALLVIEKKIGRPLETGEIIHHVNGKRDDDAPDNLMVVTRSIHNKIHKSGECHKN